MGRFELAEKLRSGKMLTTGGLITGQTDIYKCGIRGASQIVIEYDGVGRESL